MEVLLVLVVEGPPRRPSMKHSEPTHEATRRVQPLAKRLPARPPEPGFGRRHLGPIASAGAERLRASLAAFVDDATMEG
jgi:hypothetical protein